MKLDEQQKQAVLSTSKNVIVAAGAGSGKTRVITERIRWLLKTGVKPSSIVAITFTNLAAQEMRARLQDLPRVGDMFIGTIHSFANRVLKNSGKFYEIYNEEKQNNYMRYLCKNYGKHLTMDRYLEYAEIKKNIEFGFLDTSALEQFSKGELFEIEMFLGRRNTKGDKEYPRNVWSLAKYYHVITFDELLELSGEYFNGLTSEGIQHLLVDELQDIGYLEYKFLKSLGAENNFYVGDDWQAIYGFKGGNVKIFKSLIQDEAWERVDLINNYRCGLEIIRTAEGVIGQCDDIIYKQVESVSGVRGEVELGSKFHLESFLQQILDQEIEEPGHLNDWFILVRSNKDLVEVKTRLENMEIPVDTFHKSDISFSQLQDILDNNTVKVLTVHMAKGLETKKVILWGNFPLELPSYFVDKEERRVLYVGITRAKELCVLLT